MNAPIPMAPQQNFDVGALYSGTYLKADDLAGQTYAATIAAVERAEIPETDGSIRQKAAVVLQGWPSKLLLNKTNFEMIAGAYGRQSAGWIGRPIEVFPDSTLFGGRMARASGCACRGRQRRRRPFPVPHCRQLRRWRR